MIRAGQPHHAEGEAVDGLGLVFVVLATVPSPSSRGRVGTLETRLLSLSKIEEISCE
jgi:hypothetical protein